MTGIIDLTDYVPSMCSEFIGSISEDSLYCHEDDSFLRSSVDSSPPSSDVRSERKCSQRRRSRKDRQPISKRINNKTYKNPTNMRARELYWIRKAKQKLQKRRQTLTFDNIEKIVSEYRQEYIRKYVS